MTPPLIHIPGTSEARVRHEGPRVLVLINGRLAFAGDWRAADELARAIWIKARAAEEVEKAEQVAQDAALLLRTGAPFGITSHPAIRSVAARLAAWDRTLRRYLPGGVKGRVLFGRPTLLRVGAAAGGSQPPLP